MPTPDKADQIEQMLATERSRRESSSSSPLPRSTEPEAELLAWKEDAQTFMRAVGVKLLNAGYQGDSLIEGIEWLTARASSPPPPVSPDWQPWPPPDDVMRVMAWREDAGVFIAEYQCPFEGDACWFTDGGGEDLTGDLPTRWQPVPVPPSASGPSKEKEIAK